MPNNYDIIQQLIGYLQQFEKDTNEYSIDRFAQWLVTEVQNPNHNDSPGKKYQESLIDKDGDDAEDTDLRQHFVSMVSRLSKCQDFYIKKFFDGLPINTLLEYNFLVTLNKSEVLKKTDIINMNMVEYTTGIDVLKRLNKFSLVSEFRDVLDKRNKRIKITSEGKRILVEAMLRMNKMYEIFLSCIPMKAWMATLNVLMEMNEFHNKIFVQYNNKSYFEIIQFINSLNNEHNHGIYKVDRIE